MSSETDTTTDRNPSPPPEVLANDEDFVPDKIGNSMYSKRWLYKTLMQMLKVIEDCKSEENQPVDGNATKKPKQESGDSQNIVELDPKIEEDACTLWDMSANSEVAEFLCECNVDENFLSIIESTKSPRLLEIAVGILGNMSAFDSPCEHVSKNKDLVHSVISLSGCTDSCSLVQLFRLLNCGIANENCQKEWLNEIEKNSFFMENLKSILQNNLCHDVLKGLLEFLDRVLNESAKYCSMWSEEPYVLAAIESGKQLLKCNQYEDLDSFFSVVNTLCQNDSGLIAYAKHFDSLRPLFHAFFIKLGEEESLPQVSRVNTISSSFAVYGNLLYGNNILPEQVICENAVFKAMLNISKLVNSLMTNLLKSQGNKDNQNESKGDSSSLTETEEKDNPVNDDTIEEDLENWSILLEAIVYAANASCAYTEKEEDIQILEEIMNLNVSEFEDDAV